MSWSPAIGTMSLVERLGKRDTLDVLVTLLAGEASGPDLVWSSYREVLLDIGNGHANRLMADTTGTRLSYWPRVWAARSLAYLGDMAAIESLVEALGDGHWRVRMTAIQTLGRLGAEGVSSELILGLADEHRRVREATVLALGRVGDEQALQRLTNALPKTDAHGVELAIAKIEQRLGT